MAAISPRSNIFKTAGSKVMGYAKTLLNDYKTVLVETAEDSLKRPVRTGILGSGLVFLLYANRTRPLDNELNFRLVNLRQQMALLPLSIHSRKADTALHNYTDLLNSERLDIYDCWFFSLLFERDFDRRVFSPVSQDSNLKGWFWERSIHNFVDVGAFGKFYMLEKAFVDYDIKEEEFSGKDT